MKIVIIDYGSGNLRSAAKAFGRVGGAVTVTDNPRDLKEATHIVLPGVGAFGDCISGLAKIPGMIGAMEEQVFGAKKPFIGICVGMQLLADIGHEHGRHKGLGWIAGEVVKIDRDELPVPHMGWNSLDVSKPNLLLAGIESDVYFVHSYQFEPTDTADVLATTDYGGAINAAVRRENIWGVQFHPEKSQQAGLKLIENFVKM